VFVFGSARERHGLNFVFIFIEESFNGALEVHFDVGFSHQFHAQISDEVEKALKFLVFQFHFQQITEYFTSENKEFVLVDFLYFSQLDVADVGF
jgi:hypothetical protein